MTKQRWMALAFAVVVLLLANAVVSGALEYGWARRTLLNRLAASFGRPVDVGRFQISLLSGLRLEADSVTVAEDPRFGQEYFLRAEQLTAGLRWTALLRGRIEFGAVSLTHPSLNLVRLPDGSWNIESWLPPAKQSAAIATAVAANTSGAATRVTARLSRLDVDGGRINFKLADEKLPFALVGVTGYVEQDNSGRWSIDLEADPMRAPVPLQNTGTLRLRGTVAGTSARLRPATFLLTWQDASLADALRLIDGSDHGVRGALSAQLSAAIVTPSGPARAESSASLWNLQGTVRLSGVHRWDLDESPQDPAVNASLAASWRPGEPRIEVTRFALEAPKSHVNALASLDWSHGVNPSVQFVNSSIGLSDLLAWRRAFLPGIAQDLSIDGPVIVNAAVTGWPPHIQQASVSSNGAVVRTPVLPGPVRIGRVEASLQRGMLAFGPTSVSLPDVRSSTRNAAESAPSGALQVVGSLGPMHPGDNPRDWQYRVAVSGDTQRAQDLVALAAAFGRPANNLWSVEGPVALQLAWTGALHHGTSATTGSLELRDLRLNSVALNQPVIVEAATITVKGAERQVRFGAVQALGAHWTGSLHRRASDGSWDFDLSADRLDAAELDRWLGPRGQPNFLVRLLPFASRGSAPPRDAVLARLAARGHLHVSEVLLARLRTGKLDADAEIDGRRVVLRHAQADFYGGRLTGELNALLTAEPFYSFRGRVDRVDLGLMADASDSLAGRFAGLAAGELSLSARGIGRQPLTASLEGEGVLRVRNAIVRGLDLSADRGPEKVLPVAARPGEPDLAAESRYSTAAATFHLADGRVRLDQLLLVGREEQLEVDGTVSFARQMDLRVRAVPRDLARATEVDTAEAESNTWSIGGTLEAPLVRPQTAVAREPTLATGARR